MEMYGKLTPALYSEKGTEKGGSGGEEKGGEKEGNPSGKSSPNLISSGKRCPSPNRSRPVSPKPSPVCDGGGGNRGSGISAGGGGGVLGEVSGNEIEVEEGDGWGE